MGGSNTRPYRHWARLALLVGVLLVPVFGVSAEAEDALDPVLGPAMYAYPDLVPDVTTVNLSRQWTWDPATETFVQDPTTPPTLFFDTRSQNVGFVPLDLLAEEPEDLMNSSVAQCVAWVTLETCRERRSVGGFSWHGEEGHSHFHFNDFADYALRKFDKRGRVDFSARGLIAISEKVSFCLQDSKAVGDGALPAPRYAGCTPLQQGVSPGWTDIYTADIDGQQFRDLPVNIADGLYALVIDLDPMDRLYESDNANNLLVVTVRFYNGARAARIVGKTFPNL